MQRNKSCIDPCEKCADRIVCIKKIRKVANVFAIVLCEVVDVTSTEVSLTTARR